MIFNPFWITLSELLVVPGTSSTSPISAPDIYIYIYIYMPNPSAWRESDPRSIFKHHLQVWILSFPSSKLVKEPSLPNYQSIARGRIVEWIHFPRALELFEIQAALSRIWTCITLSISYDDDHYIAGLSLPLSLSLYIYIYILLCYNIFLSFKVEKCYSQKFKFIWNEMYFYALKDKNT